MITKTIYPYDDFYYMQTINNKSVDIRKGSVNLKRIKRIIGAKKYKTYKSLDKFPLETTLIWLRTYEKPIFNAIIKHGIGEALLDFRIAKGERQYARTKKKTALMMRDYNYKHIFGIERAIELHSCYLDKI